VVQYAAVRQILYVFCAYRLLVEERHHSPCVQHVILRAVLATPLSAPRLGHPPPSCSATPEITLFRFWLLNMYVIGARWTAAVSFVVDMTCRKCWSHLLRLHFKSHSCVNTLVALTQMSSLKTWTHLPIMLTASLCSFFCCCCFVCSRVCMAFGSPAHVLCSWVPVPHACTAVQLLLFYLLLCFLYVVSENVSLLIWSCIRSVIGWQHTT